MIRRTCAAVRSMFSRFSAAAIASTLSAVTGSHLRSLGSKASNPPLRQALIHRVDGLARDLHAPAARPGVHLPGDAADHPAPLLRRQPLLQRRPDQPVPEQRDVLRPGPPQQPLMLCRRHLAPPLVMTGNFPAPQGGACQRLCHRRARVDHPRAASTGPAARTATAAPPAAPATTRPPAATGPASADAKPPAPPGITGRARCPRRPHRVIHQPGQQPAQPRVHPVRPPGEPAQPLWSTPGLVETRFSPDALVWVAVVFHGTAAWRNHGLIIFPLLFYRTSVQLRCPAARLVAGSARQAAPGGLGISSSGTPVLRRGFPGLVKGDAQRHRLRRRRRP